MSKAKIDMLTQTKKTSQIPIQTKKKKTYRHLRDAETRKAVVSQGGAL